MQKRTGSLNIEQVEHLRAICLGLVWRHRQEWNRDSLLRQLKLEAEEFIQEVAFDDVDAASP